MALIPKVKLPRVALQRSTLQTPNTPKFVKPKDGKRYIRMLGVFLTLLDKWGRPQPDTSKPSIHSRRPLGVHLLPWLYHGNSYWRDRAKQNLPKVQERTLRHRSNELCRAVWRPHWPFMQKHLVRPQFVTGFQKAPFGRRTNRTGPVILGRAPACKGVYHGIRCSTTEKLHPARQAFLWSMKWLGTGAGEPLVSSFLPLLSSLALSFSLA